VRIVDANVLLYAVNEDALHHDVSRTWLDRALGGADTVGLSWVALLAFVRLSTKREVFARPLEVADAMTQVQDWIAAPGAVVVHPSAAHAELLRQAMADVGLGGNLTNDAHLVALARENRADIVSYDNDFARFTGVRWTTPEELLR
jgi:toxin-antitoxin system PIN domain toxin